MKNNNFKLYAFLIVLAIGLFFIWSDNIYLKKEVKKNDQEVKDLERKKNILFEEIKTNKAEIQRKDSIISILISKEKKILDNLNTTKNENIKNTFDYLSSDNDERFKLFSRLAAEKSNTK